MRESLMRDPKERYLEDVLCYADLAREDERRVGEELAEHLRNEKLEGLDENNIHHFHYALTAQLFNLAQLPTELLLEYDQNIVKHTQRLNDRRITRGEEPIIWKYFQYLTLLFTEIYLDRYFRNPQELLKALNT